MPITQRELDAIRANIRKATLLYQQTQARRGYFILLTDYNEEQKKGIDNVLKEHDKFVASKKLGTGLSFVNVKFPKEDASQTEIEEFKAFVAELNSKLEQNLMSYYHRSDVEKSTEHPVATLLKVIDESAYARLMQEYEASQASLGDKSFLNYGLSILGYNGPNFAVDGVSMSVDPGAGIIFNVGERGESGRYNFFGGMIERAVVDAVVEKYATPPEKENGTKHAFEEVCKRAKDDMELRDELSHALQDTNFNHTVIEYLEEVNSIELFSEGSVGLKILKDKIGVFTDEQKQEITALIKEVGLSESLNDVLKAIVTEGDGVDAVISKINGDVNKAKFKADLAVIVFKKELHDIRVKVNFDAIMQPLFMTDTRNLGGGFMATFPNLTSALQVELRTLFGINELGGYDKNDNNKYQKVNLSRMLNGFAGHAEIALHVAVSSPSAGVDQKLVENNIRLLGERAKRVAEYTPAEYQKLFNSVEDIVNVEGIKPEAKQLRQLLGMGVIEQSQFNNILGWIKDKDWGKLKTYIEILEKRTAAEDANNQTQASDYTQLLTLCCNAKSSSFTQKIAFFKQDSPFDKFLNLETAHDFACMAFYERITSEKKLFQAMYEQVGINVQLIQPFAEIVKGALQGKKEDFGSKVDEIYKSHAERMEAGAGAASNVLDLLGKDSLSESDKKAIRESVTLSVDTCKCFCAQGQTLSCACSKNDNFYTNQQNSLIDTLALVSKSGELPEYPVFLQSTEIHQNISYVTSAADFMLIESAMDAAGLPNNDKWTRDELINALKGRPVKYTLPGTTTETTLSIEDMLLYLNNKKELKLFYLGDGKTYFAKVKLKPITDTEIPDVFKRQGVTSANSGGLTWGNHCVGTETDCGTYITRNVNDKLEDILNIDLNQLEKNFGSLSDGEKKNYIVNFCASFGLVLKGGLGPHPYSMVAEGADYHPVLKLDPNSFQDGKLEIKLGEVRDLQQQFSAKQKAPASKQGTRRPNMFFASSKPTTQYPSIKSANGAFSLESMRAILDNKSTVIVQGAATGGYCVSTSNAQLLAYSKPKGTQLNVALDVEMTTGVFAERPLSDHAIVGVINLTREPEHSMKVKI
jgi:hypothetical protein